MNRSTLERFSGPILDGNDARRTMTAQNEASATSKPHRGPSLLAVAVVFVCLFVGSLISTAAMTGGGHFPSPFDPSALAARFFNEHAAAVRWSAFLQFGAAVPLAIFSATSASRLRFLGVRAAGPSIALVGGTLASAMAALSALSQWMLADSAVAASNGVVRVVHLWAFATGGPGTVVPFGILIAGIAVSGGLPRHLPRWVMWFGLAVAAAAELSSLSIAIPAAVYLLPLARFTGFVWLITAGATLAKFRGARATLTFGEP
jgi:hypothetical protein